MLVSMQDTQLCDPDDQLFNLGICLLYSGEEGDKYPDLRLAFPEEEMPQNRLVWERGPDKVTELLRYAGSAEMRAAAEACWEYLLASGKVAKRRKKRNKSA